MTTLEIVSLVSPLAIAFISFCVTLLVTGSLKKALSSAVSCLRSSSVVGLQTNSSSVDASVAFSDLDYKRHLQLLFTLEYLFKFDNRVEASFTEELIDYLKDFLERFYGNLND